jgi:hypothetical protein
MGADEIRYTRDSIGERADEERGKARRDSSTAQAERSAGAERKEKVGLLRSE